MKGLFIYDNYGSVVIIIYGREDIPEGVQSVVAVIPERMKSAYVDVRTKEVIFEIWEDDEEVEPVSEATESNEA